MGITGERKKESLLPDNTVFPVPGGNFTGAEKAVSACMMRPEFFGR